MAKDFKQIYAGTPGTTVSTPYTVPDNATTIVTDIELCNDSASQATITITIAGLVMVSSKNPILSGDTVSIPVNIVINAGQSITVLQGTSGAINVMISGVENT